MVSYLFYCKYVHFLPLKIAKVGGKVDGKSKNIYETFASKNYPAQILIYIFINSAFYNYTTVCLMVKAKEGSRIFTCCNT